MATLKVRIQSSAPNTDVKTNVANLSLAINQFVPLPITVEPNNLISSDTPNALTLGSDNKLVASTTDIIDIDFTAYYTLAKG